MAASVIPMWTARWVRLLPLSEEECSAPEISSPPHLKGQEGPGNYEPGRGRADPPLSHLRWGTQAGLQPSSG